MALSLLKSSPFAHEYIELSITGPRAHPHQSSADVTSAHVCCAVVGYIKLALQAGKANPAPPVGPALGSKVSFQPSLFLLITGSPSNSGSHLHAVKGLYAGPGTTGCGMQGLNIMQFCKEYNAATQDKVGTVIPVEITCFEVSYFARPSIMFMLRVASQIQDRLKLTRGARFMRAVTWTMYPNGKAS